MSMNIFNIFKSNRRKFKLSCGYVIVELDQKNLNFNVVKIKIPFVIKKFDSVILLISERLRDSRWQQQMRKYNKQDELLKWFKFFNDPCPMYSDLTYIFNLSGSNSILNLKMMLLSLDFILISLLKESNDINNGFKVLDVHSSKNDVNVPSDWEPEFKLTEVEFNEISANFFGNNLIK